MPEGRAAIKSALSRLAQQGEFIDPDDDDTSAGQHRRSRAGGRRRGSSAAAAAPARGALFSPIQGGAADPRGGASARQATLADQLEQVERAIARRISAIDHEVARDAEDVASQPSHATRGSADDTTGRGRGVTRRRPSRNGKRRESAAAQPARRPPGRSPSHAAARQRPPEETLERPPGADGTARNPFSDERAIPPRPPSRSRHGRAPTSSEGSRTDDDGSGTATPSRPPAAAPVPSPPSPSPSSQGVPGSAAAIRAAALAGATSSFSPSSPDGSPIAAAAARLSPATPPVPPLYGDGDDSHSSFAAEPPITQDGAQAAAAVTTRFSSLASSLGAAPGTSREASAIASAPEPVLLSHLFDGPDAIMATVAVAADDRDRLWKLERRRDEVRAQAAARARATEAASRPVTFSGSLAVYRRRYGDSKGVALEGAPRGGASSPDGPLRRVRSARPSRAPAGMDLAVKGAVREAAGSEQAAGDDADTPTSSSAAARGRSASVGRAGVAATAASPARRARFADESALARRLELIREAPLRSASARRRNTSAGFRNAAPSSISVAASGSGRSPRISLANVARASTALRTDADGNLIVRTPLRRGSR